MKIVVVIVELSPDMHKAHCPGLPGCMVLGRSRQEAAERIASAVTAYLASFDAAVPGKLDLQILDPGRHLGWTVRDDSQRALASAPGAF